MAEESAKPAVFNVPGKLKRVRVLSSPPRSGCSETARRKLPGDNRLELTPLFASDSITIFVFFDGASGEIRVAETFGPCKGRLVTIKLICGSSASSKSGRVFIRIVKQQNI